MEKWNKIFWWSYKISLACLTESSSHGYDLKDLFLPLILVTPVGVKLSIIYNWIDELTSDTIKGSRFTRAVGMVTEEWIEWKSYVTDSLRDVNTLLLISYSAEFLDQIITAGIHQWYHLFHLQSTESRSQGVTNTFPLILLSSCQHTG